MILGGHSLGASMALAYAAWDFGGRAGHRHLSGLVLIDGGLLGRLGSPQLAGIRQRLAALRTSDPFLDLLGTGVPWASGVLSATAGLYTRLRPDARAALSDFALLPASLRAPFPVTNEAALGYAFDRTTSPAALALIQVRAGRVAPTGDPRPWQDGEVTSIQNVARLFGRSPVDATEWYFPRRLSLDVDGASFSLGRNAVTRPLRGLRLSHRRTIRLPLYALQTDLSRGRVLRGARRLITSLADPGAAREARRRLAREQPPRPAHRGARAQPLPEDHRPVPPAGRTMKLLINGELVEGDGAALDVEEPARGEVFATVALPSDEQVDAAIGAGRAAAAGWAAMPSGERAELLHEVAKSFRAKTDALAEP